MDSEMSERVERFLAEIREVCERHGCQIAVSDGDGLLIFDLNGDEDPLYSAGIEDCTRAWRLMREVRK